MFKNADLMVMRAITPVHAGCGTDLGIVDLPIQREKHTNFPKIESSGIKGCVREICEETAQTEDDLYQIHNIFGYDKDSRNIYYGNNGLVDKNDEITKAFKEKEQFAGAVGFTDGKVLLFPVASAKGVFAYVTCEEVLSRFIKEAEFCDINLSAFYELRVNDNPNHQEALCAKECSLQIKDYIVVEEYTYTAKKMSEVGDLADQLSLYTDIKKEILRQKLLIVKDDDFKDFVTMNTEVITRTKINNETGTVEQGALFTEEYLPVETVMYSVVMYSAVFSSVCAQKEKESVWDARYVKNHFRNLVSRSKIMQIGSGATIGKGIVKVIYKPDWEEKQHEFNLSCQG